MNFFQRQDKAKTNTAFLVFLFMLAVALVIAAVYGLILFLYFTHQHTSELAQSWWQPDLLLKVGGGITVVVALASIFKIIMLSSGGATVAEYLGGRRVDPGTQDPGERVLLNVVEEIAIASGMPVPPVYVLDDERSINAFAAGTSPGDAVVAVTRGTLGFLDRDELQGVIAHEFSHIVNNDVQLNIRLMGVLNGILFIGEVGRMILRGSSRSSSRSKKGGGAGLLGLGLFLIGYIGLLFGQIIRAAVSRQREYLADASAVQFTRNPSGIAGALKKIGGCHVGRDLFSPHAQEASHMLFDSKGLLEFMSSHPSLVNRIRAIEPGFDGVFVEPQPIDYTLTKEHVAELHSVYEKRAQGAAYGKLSQVSSMVGALSAESLDSSKQLVRGLSEKKEMVQDAVNAQAFVFAMLVYDHASEIYPSPSGDFLKNNLEPFIFQSFLKTVDQMAKIQKSERLPLIAMCFPALSLMSKPQYMKFRRIVLELVHLDQNITMFEFCVASTVVHYLDQRFENDKIEAQLKLKAVLVEIEIALSALSQHGHTTSEDSKNAFERAAMNFPGLKYRSEKISTVDLWAALRKLSGASPQVKKQLIDASGVLVRFDQEITVDEMELLRAFSMLMDCPMPITEIQ